MDNVKYETGASTHAANNLILSVANDGTVYRDRLHIAFAYLQSANHRNMRMRDIVAGEAAKQRKTGGRFSARDISEAADILWRQTLDHALILIRDEWTGENIHVRGLKWWDAINGNTYHSVRMNIPSSAYASGRIVDIRMQYGYGDQWQWTAVDALRKMGFTIPENVPFTELPITWGDAPYTKKREMFAGHWF